MVRGNGYASYKNGDTVTLQKWGVLFYKKGGIYNSEKYGLKVMRHKMQTCTNVCGTKIIENYQDFSIAASSFHRPCSVT